MGDDPTKEMPKSENETFDGLVRRVESLELTVEQKLKQTTPLSSQLTELREYVASCFREIIQRQTQMEEQQSRMEEQQSRMEVRQSQMDERLTQMDERQTRMEAQQNRIEERQDAIEKELREIGRTMRRINVDLATALRNQDELDDRVTALETPTQPQ